MLDELACHYILSRKRKLHADTANCGKVIIWLNEVLLRKYGQVSGMVGLHVFHGWKSIGIPQRSVLPS
jgi:hypothetical protein